MEHVFQGIGVVIFIGLLIGLIRYMGRTPECPVCDTSHDVILDEDGDFYCRACQQYFEP